MTSEITAAVLQQTIDSYKLLQLAPQAFALSRATLQWHIDSGHAFAPDVQVWVDDMVPYGQMVTGTPEWIKAVFGPRQTWMLRDMLAQRDEDRPNPETLRIINQNIERILAALAARANKENTDNAED
jgi:hypothetical protein